MLLVCVPPSTLHGCGLAIRTGLPAISGSLPAFQSPAPDQLPESVPYPWATANSKSSPSLQGCCLPSVQVPPGPRPIVTVNYKNSPSLNSLEHKGTEETESKSSVSFCSKFYRVRFMCFGNNGQIRSGDRPFTATDASADARATGASDRCAGLPSGNPPRGHGRCHRTFVGCDPRAETNCSARAA